MAIDVTRQPRSEAYFSEDFVGPIGMAWLSVRVPLAMEDKKRRLAKQDPKYLEELEKLYTRSLENTELYIKQGSISSNVSTRAAVQASSDVVGYKVAGLQAKTAVTVQNIQSAAMLKGVEFAQAFQLGTSAMIPTADQKTVDDASGVVNGLWNNSNLPFKERLSSSMSQLQAQAQALGIADKSDAHSQAKVARLVQNFKLNAGYDKPDMSREDRKAMDDAITSMYGANGVTVQSTDAGPVPTLVIRAIDASRQDAISQHGRAPQGGISVENLAVTPSRGGTSAPPATSAAPAAPRTTAPAPADATPAAAGTTEAAAPARTLPPGATYASDGATPVMTATAARAAGASPVVDAGTQETLWWDLPGGGRIADSEGFDKYGSDMVRKGMALEEARRADLKAKIDAEQARIDAAIEEARASGEDETIGLRLRNVAPHAAQAAVDNIAARLPKMTPEQVARFRELVIRRTGELEAQGETSSQRRAAERADTAISAITAGDKGPEEVEGADTGQHAVGPMTSEQALRQSRDLAREYAAINDPNAGPEEVQRKMKVFRAKVANMINATPQDIRVAFVKDLAIPDTEKQAAMVESIKRMAPTRALEAAKAEEDAALEGRAGKALSEYNAGLTEENKKLDEVEAAGRSEPLTKETKLADTERMRTGSMEERAYVRGMEQSPSLTGADMAAAERARRAALLVDNTAVPQVSAPGEVEYNPKDYYKSGKSKLARPPDTSRIRAASLLVEPGSVRSRVTIQGRHKAPDIALSPGRPLDEEHQDTRDALRDAWHAMNPDKVDMDPEKGNLEAREAWVEEQVAKVKQPKGASNAAKP